MNDQRVEVYAGIDWGSQTHQACVLDNHACHYRFKFQYSVS